jgi:hypothetical protein
MAMAKNVAWGTAGAATTMLARKAMRRALHEPDGEPRLPDATRRRKTFGMMLLLAALTGAVLAFGDVLQEQKKDLAQA